MESSIRCKTLGFRIHRFGRIPVAGAARLINLFNQMLAGQENQTEMKHTNKHLYIILEARQENLTEIKHKIRCEQ